MDGESARQSGSALAIIVCPELQSFAFSLFRQDFSSCDVDRIQCANVDSERALCAINHDAINGSEIEHGDEVRQFLAFGGRLGVVEMTQQAFAINRPKCLDLQELRRYGPIARAEPDRNSRLSE